ncbi:MAG: hypothetical protein J5896_01020 [Alphaproteobacteria bacterium]|nr:hypothetical protein [Alphaproteobacteria bacterium]
MEPINKEYEPLLSYLTDIMHRLQKQSSVLKPMNIRLVLSDLPDRTDNAYCFREEKIILMGLQYLKMQAQYGEDMVAATIAHELSHIVYRNKYQFYGLSKEEEVFADMYGIILRHRAGYNTRINPWKKRIKYKINEDSHPQGKIRRLIMNRLSSSLETRNVKITPFRVNFPESEFITNLDEYPQNVNDMVHGTSQKIYTDIQIRRDTEYTEKERKLTEKRLKSILGLKSLNMKHRNFIKSLKCQTLSGAQFFELYEKVMKSDDLKDDMFLMLKFRDALAYINFREDGDLFPDLWQALDNQAINITKIALESMTEDWTLGYLKIFMDVRFRLRDKNNRQKIYKFFAQSFAAQYGKDTGTDEYGALLAKELKTLSGRMCAADVYAFTKTLYQELNIQDKNMPVLQSFMERNRFEMMSVRLETLITECLINSKQALMTLEYLTGIHQKSFQFKGVYQKKTGIKEYSYITAPILKEIRNDLENIHPSKRADLFGLLMENIGTRDNLKKLDLFVDKRDEQSDVYKKLMQMYVKTYAPDQRHDVVATLVSLKERNKPFGYEDYFKALLMHSGIDGRRVHDALYQTKSAAYVSDMFHRSSPLYKENNIIFANLRELGEQIKNKKDKQLCKIGTQIELATQKKQALRAVREI